MKTVHLTGQPREALGKRAARQLRKQALLPGVLYGNGAPLHFTVTMQQLQDLVYTPEVCFIHFTLGKKTYRCILPQELLQVHPVSEMLLHVDLCCIHDDKPVTMDIPVVYQGSSPGVAQGGMISTKLRKLKVAALPAEMPETLSADISKLDLGNTLKVKDLAQGNYKILNPPSVPIALVEIPRALRSKEATEASKATE